MTLPQDNSAPYARRALAVLIVMWVLAFTCTHLPRGTAPPIGAGDKKSHAVGFFVLGSLFAVAMSALGVRRRRRPWLAIAALAVYAALDEITQPLVNRHASVWDWLADLAGVVVAVICWELLLATAPKRSWLVKLKP